MSGFTSQQLEKRLADLNSSAQTIQTFSLWLIHHRKHHKTIVQTWFKELKKASQNRKLTFMYLANDVIQNSRKKGPEFTKEFTSALKPAFINVARDADDKTWKGLDRILSVWAERNIYDRELISELRKIIGPKRDGTKNGSKVKENSEKSTLSRGSKSDIPAENEAKKQKTSHKPSSQTNMAPMPNSKSSNVRKTASEKFDRLVKKVDEKNDSPLKNRLENNDTDKMVEPEALVRALQKLANSASIDANMKQKLVSLPNEVSDPSLARKIRDKDAAERLSKQVDEACTILIEYNHRLAQELEERKRVSSMLVIFLKNHRDALQEAENRLTELKDKLHKVSQVRDELKSHLENLPDLNLLPSVSGGLAPLPSAGDLFSIAAAKSQALSLGSTASSASPNSASPADMSTPTSTGTPNSESIRDDSYSKG